MSSPISIAERIQQFHSILPNGVKLVAVSKFHPASAVKEAYEAGQRMFGESRVQEFLEKEKSLPKDIKWHFIGHLQTNKVKSIIGKVSLIESIDSIRLIEIVNKESYKASVRTDVLMQVHVAEEETKFGFLPEELLTFFDNKKYLSYGNVCIKGIMGMASNTNDSVRVRNDFLNIVSIYEEIKKIATDLDGFETISMGMSGDWPIAVEEGANMIRIGSAIFGSRY